MVGVYRYFGCDATESINTMGPHYDFCWCVCGMGGARGVEMGGILL